MKTDLFMLQIVIRGWCLYFSPLASDIDFVCNCACAVVIHQEYQNATKAADTSHPL